MFFLANTCFELELENPSTPFEKLFSSHPNFIQLQFLPVLLAAKEDHVIVSHYPSDDYLLSMEKQGLILPHFCLLQNLPSGVDPFIWGQTQNTAKLFPHVAAPELASTLTLSSKLFAHALSPLPGSRVLYNRKDLESFSEGIIKTPHGFSGRGNFPAHAKDKLANITFPVLGEPLKKRLFDFATHWEIRGRELHYVGATAGEYTAFGSYIGNRAGCEIPFLEEQKAFVFEKKEALFNTGYFGPLSMDAMVYEESGSRLQPIIEINPRRTMGSFTLALWKKWEAKVLEIRYEKNTGQKGLLPNEKTFSKQLTYTVYR